MLIVGSEIKFFSVAFEDKESPEYLVTGFLFYIAYTSFKFGLHLWYQPYCLK
jgi:hypothetical protein